MTETPHSTIQDAPLAGLRILEVAHARAGAITRHLAELGADVILVPVDDTSFDEVAELVANTGKRLLRLDLSSQGGRQAAIALAVDADILVETSLTGGSNDWLDKDGRAELSKRNPRLVQISVTPFGNAPGYEQWQATSSVIDALSGVLSRSGFPEKSPLLPPAEIALQCAYVQATWVILLSYFRRLRTGIGDRVDLSLVEAATQAMDPGYGIAGSATVGIPASALPRGRPEARHQYPLLPCKDGYVRICVLAPRQWQGMFEWLGRPEKYADPEFNKMHVRFASPTLLPDIAAMFATKTRAQLEDDAERFGVPIAPVQTLDEATQSEQLAARRAIVEIDNGHGRKIRVPNGLLEIDGMRAGVSGVARVIDHAATWLAPVRFDPAPEVVPPFRPLTGLTVLDLGVIVAGAEQSRLLADQGALTLKFENRAFPDGARQSATGALVSVTFATGHRNKKGVGLNLRDGRGRDLFLDLVRKADVVLSNFKPGTLTSLELDFPALSAANPAIILGDSSAYGPTGPWRGRPGYGPLVRASSGLTEQWAYPGTTGDFSDAMTVYPDHVCGRIVAIGTVALLVRRMRTGRGGEGSLAQSEVITNHLGDQVAATSLGEPRPSRPDAPWDAFPCAGDDEWCVVTVRHDDDWHSLCKVMDRADLSDDPELASAGGRRARRRDIDLAVQAWTSVRTPDDAMATLQDAGIPAAKMLRVSELPDFAFFRERGAFRLASHPLISEPFFMENSIARSNRIGDPEFSPAPVPGEHTDWVARELLDLDADTIRELYAAGVMEATALPA